MLTLKILGFLFLVPGILLVFFARTLVGRLSLDENVDCNFENEMSEDEIRRYKHDKAVVNLKMMGMLVALPGFVLIMIAFK